MLHLIRLRGLARTTMLPTTTADHEVAASMYGSCRIHGEPVRQLIDCLIAAVAVSAGTEILHADVAASARHSELRLHPLSGG